MTTKSMKLGTILIVIIELWILNYVSVQSVRIYNSGGNTNIPCSVDCVITNNLNDSDVVIDSHSAVHKHLKNKLKALNSQESGVYYPVLHEYKQYGYDFVATTSPKSTVQHNYLPYDIDSWINRDTMTYKSILGWNERLPKAVAMISNCGDKNNRMDKIKQLQSLGVEIDTFGTCFQQQKDHNWIGNRIEVFRRYRFGISIENSREDGYVTEKLYLTFASGSIPIYSGADDINSYVPDSSMPSIINLDTMDISDAAQLINNETLWNDYQGWRHKPLSLPYQNIVKSSHISMECHICQWYDKTYRSEL
jgi:hypothetical protein